MPLQARQAILFAASFLVISGSCEWEEVSTKIRLRTATLELDKTLDRSDCKHYCVLLNLMSFVMTVLIVSMILSVSALKTLHGVQHRTIHCKLLLYLVLAAQD